MPNPFNKKVLVSVLMLGFLVTGSFVFLPHALAATVCTQEAKKCSDGSYVSRTGPNCEFSVCPGAASPSVKVTGKAKFVLQGAVTAVTADSLTLHVVNTSKNAERFDNKDQTIAVGKKTKITRNGRAVALNKVNKGDTVKVFGIFDKKSGAITLVRWVKVIPR